MDTLILLIIGAASAYSYSRFIYPKYFFKKSAAELNQFADERRQIVYQDLSLYPVIDNNSWVSAGYIFPDLNLYVLYMPKSVLREEERAIDASAHLSAAGEASEYGVHWRLLSYQEAGSVTDKLLEASTSLNFQEEKQGSKIIAKIGGKLPRKTLTVRFLPLLKGTTTPETRHGKEVVFAYGIDFDSEEEKNLVVNPEKYIERFELTDESALAICADLDKVVASEEFFNSVVLEGLTERSHEIISRALGNNMENNPS